MINLRHDAVSRLLELAQADAEGRVVILPSASQEQRLIVEHALSIKLLDWQVAFIWGDSHYRLPGRGTGKTLAYVIRFCLSEGTAVHLYPGGEHGGMCDEDHRIPYHSIFRDYVVDVYRKLQLQGGLKLRPIYFSELEAKEVN